MSMHNAMALWATLSNFFYCCTFSKRIRLNIDKLVKLSPILKVVLTAFLLVCFVCLKEITFATRKSAFLFCFKSSFRSGDNHNLTFQIFKCHDVIKYF